MRGAAAVALAFSLLADPSAAQQVIALPLAVPNLPGGSRVPAQHYFNALPIYYEGNYREALTSFVSSGRSGIKMGTAQWIDAIPCFTMAGECYYQTGQLSQALDQYNMALKLFVSYSDWMMRIQFPPGIAPKANPVRATPWGQSKRGADVGNYNLPYLMTQGQLDQTQVAQQGGAVQAPISFPVHVDEIVRATCLAIRRRRELMGPLCAQDPLTKNTLDVLARRPGPPNHWSEAWLNVQLGCAFAAAGSLPQAKAALERSLLVQGRFDHPLTSTALVELSRLALEEGDFAAAGRYAEETTYACANFPDPINLEEGFRVGLLAHLLLNQKAPYPPLGPAANWARSQGPRHLYASLLLLAAENMAILGDAAQAANFLATARLAMSRSGLAASQLGARLNYVNAVTAYQTGSADAGDRALDAALVFQRSGSVRMFQISLADAQYLAGNTSDRVAMLVYDAVLRESIEADWATSPLECLSVLTIPHSAAFEHWFELAVKNSKEQELALEIADRARRHRFYSTLPLGGRLLAMRWILEGPAELLGERGLLERQDLLSRYPKYAELAKTAAEIRAKLAAKPVVDDAPEARRRQTELLAELAKTSQAQEMILHEMAVRREPAEMVFPPLVKTADLQRRLEEGQVILAFFATSRKLHAFLFSHDRYAAWSVQSPAQLQKQLALLLREMGNYDANHELTPAELAKNNWRTAAANVTKSLLARSNVDLAGNFREIVIVPDGFLWYLPFEVLSVGPPGRQRLLMSQARVRYAPTAGLAVPYARARKPRPNIGVALGRLHPQDDESVALDAFARFATAIPGAVALPRTLPAPSNVYRVLLDGLIVLDDIEPAGGPYEWAPLQSDRQKSPAPLASWFSLPLAGPEYVILPGFHTAAESGLRKGPAAGGDELFLSILGLMSSGARTVLLSRWRAAGQTSLELVREFAQELPHASPSEAWQRSVQIAEETSIEPDREPRVRDGLADPQAKARHPFFWSGYLLVDSGELAPSDDRVLEIPGKAAAVRPQPANPPLERSAPRPNPGQDAPSELPGPAGRGEANGRAAKPPGAQSAAPPGASGK
jgi:hypothetical protein